MYHKLALHLQGESNSLTANRHQFMESTGMCAAELLSCNSGIRVRELPRHHDHDSKLLDIFQVDDPATAELLAMLGIDSGAPSAVAIDCVPVDLRM